MTTADARTIRRLGVGPRNVPDIHDDGYTYYCHDGRGRSFDDYVYVKNGHLGVGEMHPDDIAEWVGVQSYAPTVVFAAGHAASVRRALVRARIAFSEQHDIGPTLDGMGRHDVWFTRVDPDGAGDTKSDGS